MKRLNGIFIFLILLIGLLTIAYIWNAEAEKESLEETITQQTHNINTLEEEIIQLAEAQNAGSVKGAQTPAVGTITGIITLSDSITAETTIVCAQDKFTETEFCTDELLPTEDTNIFSYTLEIPVGKYFVHATATDEEIQTFYSEVQKCVTGEGCESDKQILIQIIEDEEQKDINLYF